MIGVVQQQANQAGISYPEYRTSIYGTLDDALAAALLDGPPAEFRVIMDSSTSGDFAIGGAFNNVVVRFKTEGSYLINSINFDGSVNGWNSIDLIFENADAIPGTIVSADSANHAFNLGELKLKSIGTAVGTALNAVNVCRSGSGIASTWCDLVTLDNMLVNHLLAEGVSPNPTGTDGAAGFDANGESGANGSDGVNPGESGQTGGDGSAGSVAGNAGHGSDGDDGAGDTSNVTLLNGSTVTHLYCRTSSGLSGWPGGDGGNAFGGGGGNGGNGYNDEGMGDQPSNGGNGGNGGSGGTAGSGGNGGNGGDAFATAKTVTVGVGCTVSNLYRRSSGGSGGNGGSRGMATGGSPGGGGLGHSGGSDGGSGSGGASGTNGEWGVGGAHGADVVTNLINNGTVVTDDG